MATGQLKDRAALLAGAGLLLANRAAIGAGLRPRIDGWRRATGLVLRGEAATFVLSAFGLDPWSDVGRPEGASVEMTRAHIAERLAAFLAREPDSCVRVRRGVDEDRAEKCSAPSYSLAFAPRPECAARFVPPQDWRGRDAERESSGEHRDPLLNIVCRDGPGGGVDMWVRASHVGIDGVPVQEILTRLETECGTAERVEYPTPEAFAPHARPRAFPERPDWGQVQAFLDFGPLLAWRKRANARLPRPMTISAALMWRLAAQEPLAGRFMGTTVEVPESGGIARGVGVVVVRPGAFVDRPDGLALYAAQFAKQMELTRARSSAGCKTLDAAAYVPARLCTAVLRTALDRQPKAFGTVALTILKDAKVFGAPLADRGHPDGFIALGGVGLPAAGGTAVGCVTVKGPLSRLAGYPALIDAAIQGCSREV